MEKLQILIAFILFCGACLYMIGDGAGILPKKIRMTIVNVEMLECKTSIYIDDKFIVDIPNGTKRNLMIAAK